MDINYFLLDLGEYGILNNYFSFDYGFVYVWIRDLSIGYLNLGVFVSFLKFFFDSLLKRFKSFLFLIELVDVFNMVNEEIIYEVELFDEVVLVKVV